jgi:hypothetical protein
MATTAKTLLSPDKGLLAFLYKVYTNQATADAFKADPWTTMEQTFDLTLEQQRLIWAAGLSREDADRAANEVALTALENGGVPPKVDVKTLKDAKWGYAGPEAALAAMLVSIMTDDPDLYDLVW